MLVEAHDQFKENNYVLLLGNELEDLGANWQESELAKVVGGESLKGETSINPCEKGGHCN